MCPMAGISAIAATITAGWSGSASTARAISSAGARALAAAASGRRAASPATAARSMSPPATPLARGNGAMARRCFASRPICAATTGRRIISRLRIGAPSTGTISTSAAPARCRCAAARARSEKLVLALGKDGRGYLLDADKLGGIGGELATRRVSTEPIRTAPAAFPASGGVFVALPVEGADCPAPRRGNGLTVLADPRRSAGHDRARLVRGAERRRLADRHDDRRPFRPDRLGARRRGRQPAARLSRRHRRAARHAAAPRAGLHHFQTLLPAAGRLYVGADDRVYAFAY